MKNNRTLMKILATLGTVLVWFPVLAPILLSARTFGREGGFHIDVLMPAELFLMALTGGGLLLWTAFWVRSRRRLIGWSLGLALVLLVGSQGFAVVTGIASGEVEPSVVVQAIVFGALAGYTLALVVMGVGGILLLRDLFKTSRPPGANA